MAKVVSGVALSAATRRTIRGWHEALGHVNPRVIRMNNGSEFVNQKVNLCGLEHVQLISSAPCTPEQNGGAERSNRNIIKTIRILLAQIVLPNSLWIASAVYIRNRLPRTRGTATLYEHFRGKKRFIDYIVAFGTPLQTKSLAPR